MRRKKRFGVLAGVLLTVASAAQPTSILDHLRLGFGTGPNAAHIIDLEPFNVFEDLTGVEYVNRYSGLLRNIGNQYFIQAEWVIDDFIFSLKPGTYTYRFSKINEVVFTSEIIEQETPYLLRYFSVPLEFRYNYDLMRFRPYAGLSVAYSHLLGSNDASYQTFIRPRISAGAVVGTYMDLRYVIFDLNAGYHAGIHNIASKSNRFETGNGATFAQNDLLLNNLQVSISLLFSLSKQRRNSTLDCYY